MTKRITLLLTFLTLFSTNAQADVAGDILKQYDVEIIIFEDAHARYINNQSWDQPATLEVIEDLKEEDVNKTITTSNNKINEDTHTDITPTILQSEIERLQKSSEYNVLFYSAWRQDGLTEDNAFEIDLNNLKNAVDPKSENYLNGKVKVVLARYLHFYAELDYNRETDMQATTETNADNTIIIQTETSNETDSITDSSPQIKQYPMSIHRRMRSKELHYIDHPLVGILLQINPVETPEETDDEKP